MPAASKKTLTTKRSTVMKGRAKPASASPVQVAVKSPAVRRDDMATKTTPAPKEPKETPKENTKPATLDDVLAKSGARDRTNVEKHLAAAEAEPHPAHAQLWRRLASKCASLASMPVQTIGLQAVLFFIPDGKYRMQVFALEDKGESVVQLYLPDVLNEAVKAKLIHKVSGDEYTV